VVEAVSGRSFPLFDEGLTAGGPGADLVIDGVDGVVAFIDPTEEGFVITDAGFGSLTVNAAPVIGQRLAQLGDRLSMGERAFWLEVAPTVTSDVAAEVAPTVVAEVVAEAPAEVVVAVALPRRTAPSSVRTALGWLLVTVVVVGSGAAGYFVAAMLRGGR
jgi:hypothetical protein